MIEIAVANVPILWLSQRTEHGSPGGAFTRNIRHQQRQHARLCIFLPVFNDSAVAWYIRKLLASAEVSQQFSLRILTALRLAIDL